MIKPASIALLLALAAPPAFATTWTVTVVTDAAGTCLSTDTTCTLRQAINSASSGDTINLTNADTNPADYSLSNGLLSMPAAGGLTINGRGASLTRILAKSGSEGIAYTSVAGTNVLKNVTVRGATTANLDITSSTLTVDSCIVESATGYGVVTQGANTVTLKASNIQNNSSDGVHALGPVAVTGCNVTGSGSNGIYVGANGSLTMSGSTVSSSTQAGINSGGGALSLNASTVSGSGTYGIFDTGALTLVDSTVNGNTEQGVYIAPGVGGLTLVIRGSTLSGNKRGLDLIGGMLGVTNSTLSGNSGTAGVGAYIEGGYATFNNVTITNNTASGSGGGVSVNGGQLTISNSIIAGNSAAVTSPDCSGTLTMPYFNLVQDTGGCTLSGGAGNITGMSANLGALNSNGGVTKTHRPQSGSPAINAGSDGSVAACEVRDQIFEPQINASGTTTRADSHSRCDIGSVEIYNLDVGVALAGQVGTASGNNTGYDVTYTATVTNYGAAGATNLVLSDTLPGGSTLVSTSGDFNCSGTSTLSCTLSSLAPQGVAHATIVVHTATTTGSLNNTVTVTRSEGDTNGSNDSAMASVMLTGADLVEVQTLAPTSTVVGGTVTATLTITNNGPASATGVVLTDTPPSPLQVMSATPSQGSCSGTAVISCPLGTLANGASATVTIVFHVTGAGELGNLAEATAATADPDKTNNKTFAIEHVPVPDMAAPVDMAMAPAIDMATAAPGPDFGGDLVDASGSDDAGVPTGGDDAAVAAAPDLGVMAGNKGASKGGCSMDGSAAGAVGGAAWLLALAVVLLLSRRRA
jgi:uncharacterized repeat protein (TIGR01451 family)